MINKWINNKKDEISVRVKRKVNENENKMGENEKKKCKESWNKRIREWAK